MLGQIPLAFGLSLQFDGAPMRIFRLGKGPEVSEIIRRRLTAVLGNGKRRTIAPTLCRCGEKSAFGILGAISPDQCFIEDLVRGSSKFKFLFIVADSAPTNRALIMAWTASLMKHGRLIVIHSPCWQHILSNCTGDLGSMVICGPVKCTGFTISGFPSMPFSPICIICYWVSIY